MELGIKVHKWKMEADTVVKLRKQKEIRVKKEKELQVNVELKSEIPKEKEINLINEMTEEVLKQKHKKRGLDKPLFETFQTNLTRKLSATPQLDIDLSV